MSPRIVVVIRQDPRKSGRAVEGLRIALGLATGPNPVSVVLLNEAGQLLSEEYDDLVDAEILDKHRPVLKELEISFLVEPGAIDRFGLEPGFAVREAPFTEIQHWISTADRVLVF